MSESWDVQAQITDLQVEDAVAESLSGCGIQLLSVEALRIYGFII